MSKALSVDLRERVLRAIAEGMSGRQAGLRFGVSAASVSRWRNLALRQGNAKPGPLGGDRRSQRIEAQASVILRLVEEKPDMTLGEIRAALLERGHAFGIGTLWRFFERHRECQEFRVWACIMGSMETPHGTTERPDYPGRNFGPIAGRC